MARVNSVAGHTVEQHSSPNVGGKMTEHRGLVLHIAEGSYRGTINWQMNPDQRYASGGTVTTSSTWVVGREPGEIAQMSDSDTVAWCQRSGSYTWNSVELAGYAPNPPTAWQIEACAHLLVWLHTRYGVPLQVATTTTGRGLGHHSMDNDTTVEWGHDSCPGSGVINAKPKIVARAKELLAPPEEDTMTPAEFLTILDDPTVAARMRALPWQYQGGGIPAGSSTLGCLNELVTTARGEKGGDDAILARMNELAAAEQQRDTELRDLLAAHQSGQLSAEDVVRRMGEMLSGTTSQPAQG